MSGSRGQEQLEVDRVVWVDGELVPWRHATVHLLSHALQRGSLVFDYMSVHPTASPRGDCIFRLAEHVERFVTSCEMVGLPLEQSADEIAAAIRQTARANPGARAVKVSAYLSSIEVDVVPQDDHLTVAIAAYDPRADIIAHKQAPYVPRPTLKLWIEKERKNRRQDIMPPQAKVAANYASPMAAKWKARQAGYDEIVLVDEHGHLAEGPTTNLFLVDGDGALCTPPEDIVLLGVTRRSILDLAKHDGLTVREAPLSPPDLFAAAEVFLTGTTAGVWPVISVDDQVVGDGEPGPVSTALREHFLRVTNGEDSEFAHWLTPVSED